MIFCVASYAFFAKRLFFHVESILYVKLEMVSFVLGSKCSLIGGLDV